MRAVLQTRAHPHTAVIASPLRTRDVAQYTSLSPTRGQPLGPPTAAARASWQRTGRAAPAGPSVAPQSRHSDCVVALLCPVLSFTALAQPGPRQAALLAGRGQPQQRPRFVAGSPRRTVRAAQPQHCACPLGRRPTYGRTHDAHPLLKTFYLPHMQCGQIIFDIKPLARPPCAVKVL